MLQHYLPARRLKALARVMYGREARAQLPGVPSDIPPLPPDREPPDIVLPPRSPPQEPPERLPPPVPPPPRPEPPRVPPQIAV